MNCMMANGLECQIYYRTTICIRRNHRLRYQARGDHGVIRSYSLSSTALNQAKGNAYPLTYAVAQTPNRYALSLGGEPPSPAARDRRVRSSTRIGNQSNLRTDTEI